MHRRMDSEISRREPREHDQPRPGSNSGRLNRKRPSMLSEFHGSKYHTHNMREGDRDGDLQHYRTHNRYVHDSSSGLASSGHQHSFQSSAFHSKPSKSDSRSRHTYHHSSSQHRSTSHHHHNSHHHTNSEPLKDEETPAKRPRMMGDSSWKRLSRVDRLNSTESMNNSMGGGFAHGDSPGVTSPVASTSLSAYHLEDIDSDDDDSFLKEDDEKKLSKSPTPVPLDLCHSVSTNGDDSEGSKRRKMSSPAAMPSKEELLIMMDKVDRDIAAVETQISALQKKQAELEETAKAVANATPRSGMSFSSSTHSPSRGSSRSELEEEQAGKDFSTVDTTPQPSPKKSPMDVIFSDNRVKAKSARAILSILNFPPTSGQTASYYQPYDSPCHQANIDSHQAFRTKLVQWLLHRKLEKHAKEMELCKEFDSQMAKWEKSVERIENNPKKRARDQKNRELFERYFPELKTRREQQERFTRVDQRGFGIVRSDAEMKEIMFELSEQQEAPVRHRRTHAAVPPMLVGEREMAVQYDNKNGLIADPMALHRESCFTFMWSEEEKATFRDKYMFNPKDFETIASFLPNKSPADCVLYYYLSKKREKFKHLVRKANFKRKKAYIKPSEMVHSSMVQSTLNPPLPLSLFASAKPKSETIASSEQDREKDSASLHSEYGDWTNEEISCLKEGLRKYGRAWGKIYRVVGGRKTATQCKQFYDKFCTDSKLELTVALADHSSMKSAEKLRRKAENRKSESSAMTESEKAHSNQQNQSPEELEEKQEGNAEEIDSENTESAYETDSKSGDESGSESTITDSCPEDSTPMTVSCSTQQKSFRGTKKSRPQSDSSSSGFKRSSEEALDLFISAAEALNNIVPPEVALHDHNYALPPSSLAGNMDGLSLIAAAAAVVSPTLSRSAGGNRVPSLSPVRAPRGRPPNSQRKGTNNTTSKLAPTLLSPAGSSNSVLLTDMKAAPLRGRTRSAPSDRPKLPPFHVPRPSSTLARMSLNSNSRPSVGRGGSTTGLVSATSNSKHRTDSGSPSLKSMIAFQPPSTSSSQTSTGVSTSNSISAFEALVNVAAAAHPAELPQSSLQLSTSQATTISKLSSFPVSTPSTLSFTATNLPSSQPPVTLAVTAANSNASNSTGTTTAFLDFNQTINLLVSLAQQPGVSGNSNNTSQPISMLPNQRILTPVNLFGNIVMQGSKTSSNGTLSTSTLPTTRGSRTLSSALSDTILSHLTSSINSQANSNSKNTQGKAIGMKSKKLTTTKSDSSITRPNSASGAGLPKEHNGKGVPTSVSRSMSTQSSYKSGEDVSNLDLFSFVAAVAASQASTESFTTVLSTATSSTPVTTIGYSSSLLDNITELKRFADSSTPSTLASSSSPSVSTASVPSSIISSNHDTPASDESNGSPSNSFETRKRLQDSNTNMHVDATTSVKVSSSSCPVTSSDLSGLDPVDNLPRSVVRNVMGCNDDDQSPVRLLPSGTTGISSSSENDMTASLASIIPSYTPSVGNQSLLLYTRSLSFPLSSEPSVEEEDHLASATRGISELSKLLGTDSEAGSKPRQEDSPMYKDSTGRWNPSDLLNSSSASIASKKGSNSEFTETPDNSGSYLSSVLESQIHGTVHHASLTASMNSTSTNSSVTDNMESTLDMDHSR